MIEVKPPGTRFGPYEVIDLIGSGGMGVVYKARDTRLLREVAIKVLPDSIVHFQASLERFEREARAASALNHPNVVIVHDIGKADEKPYIAMELVEGRTLRELLDGGALPTRRAVEIATQIADALASAHTRGIVHRDLKPENVMVTEDGRVKILDFGLAQLREPLPGEGAVASDALPTSPGVILGTAGYMSPEQAEGRNTDFRSDQFALGAFLYEMVGGHPPFKRPSFAETLTAIIRDEPEPLPIQDPAYDRPIHWIIDRCLAKDPEQRYHSTRDLAKDLERIRLLSLSMASGQPVAAAVSRKFSRRPLAILLAALTLALLALAIPQLSWMIARPTTSHFQKLSFNRGIIWSARFAPDGRSVFYSAAWDGGPFKIYQKYPESPEAIPLPLPSADLLAVSSAGELAVLIDWHIIPPGRTTGVLARVPFTGGTPRRVADDVQYADWSPDGKDLALVRTRAGRSLLEYPLGRTIYQTTGWLDSPRISPDGESIAIFEHPTPVESRGVLIVLDRQGHKRLTSHDWPSSAGLAWAKSGREVWLSAAHERELRAIWAFDLAGRQRLIQTAPGRLSLLDVSADNRALVARESRFFGIGYIDSSGHERDVSHFDSSILADLSSDGRTILFTEFG
ncbi:MAG: protein kinase, partial [Vicinamibacteria bacterium]|nr:protein kinase [Vicinamibacteria bacterium]